MNDLEKARRGIYPKCPKCGETKYYIAKRRKTCDKCRGRVEDLNHKGSNARRICSKETHTQEEMREILGYAPIIKSGTL